MSGDKSLETGHLVDLEPSEAKDPYVGEVLAERYRIVRKLGGGGMGDVYEGEHVLIGKRVAVKLLHAAHATNGEVVRRFMNEARAAAMLGHPNIIDSSDMGKTPRGEPFLVLEYLEGHDLDKEIQSVGPMPVPRTVKIVQQMCAGLGAAHARGIVHRDMKPENVFLVARGGEGDHVKILDFGISKFTNQEGPGTRTGTMLGTPSYMSPEQLMDTSKTDLRTDVYAVGVILYRMLSGRVPFRAETFAGLALKVMTEEPEPLRKYRPELPDALAQVVARALAKNAADRYASMEELSRALEPFAHYDAGAAALDASGDTVVPGTPTAGMDRAPGAFVDRRPSPAAVTASLGTEKTLVADASAPATSVSPAPTLRDAPRARAIESDIPNSASSEGAVRGRARWPWALAAAAAVALGAFALARPHASPTPPTPVATPPVATPPAATPPAPSVVAQPAAATSPPATHTVALDVASHTFGASVSFRGQSAAVPAHLDVERGALPEPIEVTAPGYQGRRFRLVVDQPRRLSVELRPGRGIIDASDAELLVALGAPADAVAAASAAATPSAHATGHAGTAHAPGAPAATAPSPAPAQSHTSTASPSGPQPGYHGPSGSVPTTL